MNNLKKTVLGLAVAGLAFGFSAFTTIKNQSMFVYYRTDATNLNPADPYGYQYFSADRCEGGGDICSALWDIGDNIEPAEGDWLPNTGVTFQSGSIQQGHFE